MSFLKTSQIQRSYKNLTKTISEVQAAHISTPKEFSDPVHKQPNLCSSSQNNAITLLDPQGPKLRQTLITPKKKNSLNSSPPITNPYATSNPPTSPPLRPDMESSSIQTKIVKENVTDNVWVGHRLRALKPSCARLWIQNVFGLDISNNFNPYLEHLDFIKRYNIQFLALTESHLNHQNRYVKENIEASHSIIYPEGHVLLSNTPTDDFEDTRRSGGILSSTQGKLSNRFAGGGCDKGGRYTWMDFFGKDLYLRVYTVYRVCNGNNASAGDNQAWTLQKEWLSQIRGIEENPRRQILKDLKEAITSDLKKNREILVVGDFNENVLSERGETVRLMKQLGLVNVLESNVNAHKSVRSFCRGSSIIDGVWATTSVERKIVSCGLAPFNYIYQSDHRGIFLDIDILDLLDARDISVQSLPYRRLKCTIPKRVKSYSEEVIRKWSNHKIKDKIDKLEDMSNYIDDPSLYASFTNYVNQYDLEIGGILSSSERNCCSVGRHCQLLFTPELHKLLRNRRQVQQQLNKKKKLPLQNSKPYLIQELKSLQKQFVQLNRDLRQYSKNQRTKRDEFLEERAEDLRQKRDLPKSKLQSIVKNLKHIEKQIYDASMIRNVLKPGSKTRTDFIMIPALSQYSEHQKNSPNFDFLHIDTIWPRLQIANGKDITEWYNVEDPSTVEHLILEALQKHFSQASDTLITSPYWRKLLSSKEGQNKLLDGTIEWDDDVPIDFRELLSTFQNKMQKPISFNLSYDAFVRFIQLSKEKTSTSPSSRHYGHYKALLESAPDALHDIFRLMKISVKNGVFLQRYKKTLTTLICKESGTPYLHRFRPIHIIEAELQFITKSIWAKKMIRHAESNQWVTDAQYGGRRGRQAQSSVLNTTLYYDIHRQLRKDYTSNDDDMKANFDREIPHYSAAELRSIGMPFEAGQFMIKATASQEYFIRTSSGTSDLSYSYSNERPIWGLGQGVGWAGACWQITASTISKCMNDNCVGIYLCCPERKIHIEKLMDFFIDDTKKICNQMKNGMSLREQTQFNMQKHTYYISTTGGSLALDKCTWYQINFSFDSNGDPYILNKTQMPGDIRVFRNFHGEKVTIKRLEFDTAHRTLGYFLRPDGKSDDHYTFTEALVQKWKARVTSSRLNSTQILKSYLTVLNRQLVYRLAATSFSYEQCNDLMKIISPILLHAANVQANFPRSIMEAGEVYAGFGFTHLYDLHGQEKLQFFFMHTRKGDNTGKLLDISLRYTQLRLGIATPFFKVEYDEYSYLCDDTWLTHLWEYTSSRGLTIDLTNPGLIPIQRQNDKFIMDILHKSPSMRPHECVIANKVRLALQILHLSDIVDGTGRKLLPDIRNGILHRTSKLNWPQQILLPKWMPIWHKACGVLQRYVSGNCLGERFLSHQNWNWKADSSCQYISNGDRIYEKKSIKHYDVFILSQKSDLTPEIFTVHVDLSFNHKGRPKPIFFYSSAINARGPPDDSSVISNLAFWNSVFGNWDILDPPIEAQIIDGIKMGDVIMGLDGSVTSGYGAYSFGFFTSNAEPIFLHHGPVHGDEEQQNSTRSEMHGILAGILYLNYILQKHEFVTDCPPVVVVGDNLESLRVSREGPSTSLKDVFSSDKDVAWEIRAAIKNSNLTFNFEHVKSHQDDLIPYEDLCVHAKINVQCDKFVTQYFKDPIPGSATHKPLIPHYPNQIISIKNHFTRITSSYRSNIHRYKVGHDAEKQCAKTWKIAQRSLCKIDWGNLRKEFRSRRGNTRFQLTKAIHRQWPVMSREKSWNRATSSICPLCKKTDEDTEHIFQCSNDLVRTNRTILLSKMKTSFTKYKTSPLLINHIMRMLYQYCGGHRVTKIKLSSENNPSHILKKISRATEVQIDDLGIQNMLLGIVTPEFLECQKLYLQSNSFGQNYNADRWGRWFLREMIDFSTQLWKYRCTLIHDKKEGTMEHRLRCLAVDWLEQLKQHQTLIPIQARHLLNRSSKYFKSGPIRSVNAWIRRIEIELQQKQIPSRLPDIRKWLQPTLKPTSNTAGNSSGDAFDDSTSVSTYSQDDAISSYTIVSCNAICDLLLETDTIPTFPYYKHQYQMDTEDPALYPETILISNMENTGDRYANVRMKCPVARNMIIDTDEESDSDYGSSEFSVG